MNEDKNKNKDKTKPKRKITRRRPVESQQKSRRKTTSPSGSASGPVARASEPIKKGALYKEVAKLSARLDKRNHKQSRPLSKGEGEEDKYKQTWKAYLQLAVVAGFIVLGFYMTQVMKRDEQGRVENERVAPLLVETMRVTPQNRPVIFEKTGTVSVTAYVDIIPQVSGKIEKLDEAVRSGSAFKKGEKLFGIEQADFINEVYIAKSDIAASQVMLDLAKAESEAAIAEWKSMHPDQDVPDLVARRPQLDEARANLAAAKARVDNAKLSLKRTSVTYPFDGRVVSSMIENGQFVQAGQSYGRVYSKSSLEIIVPIEPEILENIDLETTELAITLMSAGREKVISGKIDRIGSIFDEETRFAELIVKPVDDGWENLLPNIFVDAKIIGNDVQNLWRVPNAALQGRNRLWLVDQDNKLVSFTPRVLSSGKENSLVLGNGQIANVVLGLLKGASEGMSVRVMNDNEEKPEQNQNSPIKGGGELNRAFEPLPNPLPQPPNQVNNYKGLRSSYKGASI